MHLPPENIRHDYSSRFYHFYKLTFGDLKNRLRDVVSGKVLWLTNSRIFPQREVIS